MTHSVRLLIALTLFALALGVSASAQNSHHQPKLPLKILLAKSAYFEDQTAWPAVGAKALSQLKKWGRFRIVQDKRQAELVLLLSEDPNRGGHVTVAGGQTGTVNRDGSIAEDSVPNFDPAAVTRYVYLTVMDPQTGEVLWKGSHRWGGLLTGFDSAGERVVKQFQKEISK